jgi:glycosyltransferase involved in cell wall biosynthesis
LLNVYASKDVSIVVPTRNSARTLAACLRSIRNQSIPCELIVVDNKSTDATPVIAGQWADVVIAQGPERSAQRNAGMRAASGAVVGFIDSDMQLESGVAEEAVRLLEGGAGGVIVPEYTDGSGYWVGVRRLERSFYDGRDQVEAARFFRRELVEEVGGFDEDMPPGPEDWDLTIRVREIAPIERTSASIRHDEGTLHYFEACRKKAYYAPGLVAFSRKHGAGQLASAFDRPYIRRPWKLAYPHPLLGAGVVALKAGETAAVAASVVKARLSERSSRLAS